MFGLTEVLWNTSSDERILCEYVTELLNMATLITIHMLLPRN